MNHTQLAHLLRRVVKPLTGKLAEFDSLIDLVGDAKFVLIGEATHGTDDFYRTRAELTKRLIQEKGFQAVAVEADWPDSYRVNEYVTNPNSKDARAADALGGFIGHFPHWMWRNTAVVDFVEWLKDYNARSGTPNPCGFFGLDLYSLHKSARCVIDYYDKKDNAAAKRARQRYSCLDEHGEDPQRYGMAAAYGDSCEQEVIEQVMEMRRKLGEELGQADGALASAFFNAYTNAEVVRDAEKYYRSMFFGNVSTWNIRDEHMANCADSLQSFLQKRKPTVPAKIVIWEHNSHVGDARATDVKSRRKEWNIGQLLRERHGTADTFIVGFTTYAGTVCAADHWDGKCFKKSIVPAAPGSYERLFHDVAIPRFLLNLKQNKEHPFDEDAATAIQGLKNPLLERAIGVIYRPDTERQSHYFLCSLPKQFDAIIHYDVTQALRPLESTGHWEEGELPETYPYGV